MKEPNIPPAFFIWRPTARAPSAPVFFREVFFAPGWVAVAFLGSNPPCAAPSTDLLALPIARPSALDPLSSA